MLRLSVHRFLPAIFGAALILTSANGQEVLNGIAAVVNNDVVTFGEVRELVGPKERAARESLKGEALVEKIKEIRLAAINDLIDRALILQEFKTKGYQIPDYLIDERVQEIIRDSFGGDRQAFLRTLTAQGFTLEKFREFQRDSVIVQEMRRQATKGVATVSDQKIQEYYKEHAEEYSTQEEIKLRMIVIRGGPENNSRRKMIEEIREKIVAGAEFGDLARMYSDGSEQESYGDVGWINRKHFNESLTKIAFALKPGEMSQIIELGGSYYLLLCEAKKQASVKPLKDMRPEIEKALLQSERQKQQQEWLMKLRKKAFIKLY
jgi:peptidyl-prolyl cis-trans isomerase SurA